MTRLLPAGVERRGTSAGGEAGCGSGNRGIAPIFSPLYLTCAHCSLGILSTRNGLVADFAGAEGYLPSEVRGDNRQRSTNRMIPTIFHPAGSRRRLPPLSILSTRNGLMLGLSDAGEAAAGSSAHRRNIAVPLHSAPYTQRYGRRQSMGQQPAARHRLCEG